MANFSVEYLQQDAKVVTDALGRRILLHRTARPPNVAADLAVKYPVERAIASSPITLAFALRLNETVPVLDRFVGIVNVQEAHLMLPELVKRYKSGQIRNVASLRDFRDIEHDIVFTFAFPHDNPALAGAIQRLGLHFATIDAWYESDFNERIKWMEFIAHFFGVEEKAHRVIEEISRDIERTAMEMRSDGQSILWFADFQDYQFITGGGSWVAQAVRKLGGNVITPDSRSPGSVDTSREWIAGGMSRADAVVFTMVRPSIQHIKSIYPKIVESPAYTNDRVFGFNVGYWQEGTYSPETWFKELATILRPNGHGLHELRLFAHVPTSG